VSYESSVDFSTVALPKLHVLHTEIKQNKHTLLSIHVDVMP
jgi:hypothetical protein